MQEGAGSQAVLGCRRTSCHVHGDAEELWEVGKDRGLLFSSCAQRKSQEAS